MTTDARFRDTLPVRARFQVCERKFVEQSGIHHPTGGKVVNHHIDELSKKTISGIVQPEDEGTRSGLANASG